MAGGEKEGGRMASWRRRNGLEVAASYKQMRKGGEGRGEISGSLMVGYWSTLDHILLKNMRCVRRCKVISGRAGRAGGRFGVGTYEGRGDRLARGARKVTERQFWTPRRTDW